jgi:hypothetical protein
MLTLAWEWLKYHDLMRLLTLTDFALFLTEGMDSSHV